MIEFFATKADAEAELEQILRDEPGWASVLSVVAVDFSGEAPQLLATPKKLTFSNPSDLSPVFSLDPTPLVNPFGQNLCSWFPTRRLRTTPAMILGGGGCKQDEVPGLGGSGTRNVAAQAATETAT